MKIISENYKNNIKIIDWRYISAYIYIYIKIYQTISEKFLSFQDIEIYQNKNAIHDKVYNNYWYNFYGSSRRL